MHNSWLVSTNVLEHYAFLYCTITVVVGTSATSPITLLLILFTYK